MSEESKNLRYSLWLPIAFVGILWVVKIIETVVGIDFSDFGVYPRSLRGIIGIFTAPFIHGDWEHLFSNSVPLIALGFLVLQSYRAISLPVILFIYLMSGLGMWVMGRPSHHIGASGLVYGLAFFLFASGILRKDTRSMALAAIVVIFYGGMVWGMLPGLRGISWEGHLAGAVAGVAMAYRYRKVNLPTRYEWETDPTDYDQEGEIIIEEPFWVLPPPPDDIMPEEHEQSIQIPVIQQTNDDTTEVFVQSPPPIVVEDLKPLPDNITAASAPLNIDPNQMPIEIRYHFKPKDE